MSRLPPLVSRLLAVLILLGGLAILYVGAIAPLVDDYMATRQSIEDGRDALARFRRVAAELPQRRADLAALRQRQALSEGFLQGTNEALVAAQIQNRVKALSEASHGELRSTQVLPTQDEGKYRRITIRVQMTLDITAAQSVLYGIESASPLLFLDNVDLRAHLFDRRHDRGGVAPPNEGMLDVRFDVYGYMRSGKAASDRPPAAAVAPASVRR